jgi:hypothetical protein
MTHYAAESYPAGLDRLMPKLRPSVAVIPALLVSPVSLSSSLTAHQRTLTRVCLDRLDLPAGACRSTCESARECTTTSLANSVRSRAPIHVQGRRLPLLSCGERVMTRVAVLAAPCSPPPTRPTPLPQIKCRDQPGQTTQARLASARELRDNRRVCHRRRDARPCVRRLISSATVAFKGSRRGRIHCDRQQVLAHR